MSEREARIIINGHVLSFGASMTVRVAIQNFLAELNDPNALGKNQFSRELADAYKNQLRVVMAKLSDVNEGVTK